MLWFSIIVLATPIVAFLIFSRNKFEKKQNVFWGLTTMFVIVPLFSLIFGITYGMREGSGLQMGQ